LARGRHIGAIELIHKKDSQSFTPFIRGIHTGSIHTLSISDWLTKTLKSEDFTYRTKLVTI